MAISETSICNIALGQIGAGRIADINGTQPVEKDCKVFFEQARRDVLATAHWRFARKFQALTMSANTPKSGYSFEYPLPSDHISPVKLVGDYDFQVVGDAIHSNQEATAEQELVLEYTAEITDPTKFTSKFVNLLVARLCGPLAMSVKKDPVLAKEKWDDYEDQVGTDQRDDMKTERHNPEPTNTYVDERNV